MKRYEDYSAKPKPDQMFQLASIVVCLAKEQGKLRPHKNAERTHFFLPHELETLDFDEEEGFRHNVHRYIGRVGKTGFQKWTMRIAEPYWVTGADGVDGYRSSYMFEWRKHSVDTALHSIHVHQEVSEPSLIPSAPDLGELQPDFLHASLQFEQVSKHDCSRLISDVSSFSNASRYDMKYNR